VTSDVMLAVSWRAVPTGTGHAAAVISVGPASLHLPCPTLWQARREGRRLADRLALVAVSRSSLAQVHAVATASGASLWWGNRILWLLSNATAREAGVDAPHLAAAWTTSLQQAARSAWRPSRLPDNITMGAGETRLLALPSAYKNVTAISSTDAATARGRLAAGPDLALSALRPGSVTLRLERPDGTSEMRVNVLERAGRLPAAVTVRLAGGTPPSDLAELAVAHAVEQASQPRDGASVDWYAQGGDRITAWLEGEGTWPVAASLLLHIERSEARFGPPGSLAASNQPERLEQDGTLLNAPLRAGDNVFYFHHQDDPAGPPRVLGVRLDNHSDQPVHLLLSESGAGPSRDELYAGHLAAWRYMHWFVGGNGWEARIAPHGSYRIDSRVLHGGDVACGIGRIEVLEGAPPSLVVDNKALGAAPPSDDNDDAGTTPLSHQSQSEELGGVRTYGASAPIIRGHGVYDKAQLDIEQTYTVGGPYGFILIGAPPYPEPIGDGTPNAGNYGVLYNVHLHMVNPTSEEKTVYLCFTAPSGVARASLVVDGQLLETPLLGGPNGPSREFLLKSCTLEPGGTQDATVLAVPEPGSNYPVRLVVKPLPPNR
jgi:hypothetical protein